MTFKPTANWIIGFTDAEGCFSICITNNEKFIGISFTFYISQKIKEPLIKYQEFLKEYIKQNSISVDTEIPKLVPGNGTENLRIRQHDLLLKVIRPFFEEFPLLSSKWQDCQLFFAALDIHKDKQMTNHVRILKIAHIMFAMNTEGEQRIRPLTYYENFVKPRFKNKQLWEIACLEAKKGVKEILDRPYPSLTKKFGSISFLREDYFFGLLTGDGCFHADFDCRKGRTVKVRKSLSISMIKTTRNEELLNAIAEQFDLTWKKRLSAKNRHSWKIEKSEEINQILQPFFLKNAKKFPIFKRRHLECWLTIDKLLKLLKGDLANFSAKSKVMVLLMEIYNVHDGTYRKYSREEIINRFRQDWIF
uniref:Putative LAGLIDADG homing endonuclease n=1 Tax=Jenufa perforata TaxID=993091 RepID=A0A0S2LNC4_9CHLO|nr:putative LAGLIDADG homing endonuclease [Jenufa perforata]ALO62914.1 putative LAGLIDADG homing endonuclease [Jenufa perforata]